jgi:hypothetical protein
MADGDEEWVEIRRFVDATNAEMTRDFLRDHDIDARIRGNSGATGVLNRFTTVIDTRLDVRRGDLDAAREALHALEAGAANEDPFRGRRPVEPDDELPYAPPKKASAAMFLALLIPIGAGHFYARHGAAGTILLAGIAGGFVGGLLGGGVVPMLACALIVGADIVLCPFAVRRNNQGRIPSDGRQRAFALAVVAAAFAAAYVLGRGY